MFNASKKLPAPLLVLLLLVSTGCAAESQTDTDQTDTDHTYTGKHTRFMLGSSDINSTDIRYHNEQTGTALNPPETRALVKRLLQTTAINQAEINEQLQLTDDLNQQIADQAAATYPEECCGILIGTHDADTWILRRVVPVENVWDGPRENRFMLDPLAYIREERRAQAHTRRRQARGEERGAQEAGRAPAQPAGEASP